MGVGAHTALVDYVIAPDEWAFADTDAAMRAPHPHPDHAMRAPHPDHAQPGRPAPGTAGIGSVPCAGSRWSPTSQRARRASTATAD